MALTEIFDTIAANPQLLAALMAVIYNIAGYLGSMLKIKALEGYQVTKLAETLLVFEGLFLILTTLGGLPVQYTTAITVVGMIIISLGKKVASTQPAT